MSTLDLYNMPGTASTRAVQMTAKAVGVQLNSKFINTQAVDHLKPEFVKINPSTLF